MATLDVLDYAMALDAALEPRLPPAQRKMAVKEARRIIEDMAFRFAFMEERVLPEDIDYVRALEAMKPPPRAADVLARRAPVYARRRRRKLATSSFTLAILAVVVLLFSNMVTSEASNALVTSWVEGSGVPISDSFSRDFNVSGETSRLQLTASVTVFRDASGARSPLVTVTLLDPDGQIIRQKTFTERNAVYMKEVVEAPRPGQWTILVDYVQAAGRSEIDVLGVVPAK